MAKARSGAKWTEQDYAEHGIQRIVIRAPARVAKAFDELCAKLGASRAVTLEALLEQFAEDKKDS